MSAPHDGRSHPGGEPGEAPQPKTDVGVHAFLIADVRGWTRFTQEQGDEQAGRLAGALAMYGVHMALPDAKWLVDLVGSFAVGGLVYVGVLVAVGLKPSERTALFRVIGRSSAAA